MRKITRKAPKKAPINLRMRMEEFASISKPEYTQRRSGNQV
jgi:hypothetical protein